MHPIERLRYVARAGDADPSLLAEEAALALGALADEPRALVPAARRLLEFHPACAPLWWVCAELLHADDPATRAQQIAAELSDDPTGDELAAALPGAATLVTSGGPIIATALPERPDLSVHLVASAAQLRYQLRRLGELVDVSGFLEHEVHDALEGASVVVVEAEAVGPSGALLTPVAAELALAAEGAELWIVAGRGRLLPTPLFDALAARADHPKSPPSRRLTRYEFAEEDDESELDEPGLVLVPTAQLGVLVGPEGPQRPAAAFARLRCPVPPELLAVARH